MKSDQHNIAIIGLGYVGLPLAVAFAKHYKTIGFDINPARIEELVQHNDSTLEVSTQELKQAENLQFTANLDDLSS
ncbi:MAG TPA: Vi polysaccharide biosynthesis UDP-N-acetylglucosamine C-6 dehydrogenase TviB, partial [Oceanospirillales bacterium]|nr:Vi polysaccharide biosynthesis UDP-N-acetylglucosamine C-6 dehydrogenase TviB [Oceanospirillales bacterium]